MALLVFYIFGDSLIVGINGPFYYKKKSFFVAYYKISSVVSSNNFHLKVHFV